jgi:hypothetical protein
MAQFCGVKLSGTLVTPGEAVSVTLLFDGCGAQAEIPIAIEKKANAFKISRFIFFNLRFDVFVKLNKNTTVFQLLTLSIVV